MSFPFIPASFSVSIYHPWYSAEALIVSYLDYCNDLQRELSLYHLFFQFMCSYSHLTSLAMRFHRTLLFKDEIRHPGLYKDPSELGLHYWLLGDFWSIHYPTIPCPGFPCTVPPSQNVSSLISASTALSKCLRLLRFHCFHNPPPKHLSSFAPLKTLNYTIETPFNIQNYAFNTCHVPQIRPQLFFKWGLHFLYLCISPSTLHIVDEQ